MIKVWTDTAEAGLLDRSGARGSTFVYQPGVSPVRAVSVTMPVRLPSWDIRYGLPPIFEMNLPEGVLRERLRLAFAKATGTFDEFDLLAIVGRSQVGRIRYTGQKEQLQEDVPFQSVDEILEKRRGGDLFRHLIEKFASFSGISGVIHHFPRGALFVRLGRIRFALGGVRLRGQDRSSDLALACSRNLSIQDGFGGMSMMNMHNRFDLMKKIHIR